MRKIKTLIANWRAERRRKRELYRQLEGLTDYGLLDRILNPDAQPVLTLDSNMFRNNIAKPIRARAIKVQ